MPQSTQVRRILVKVDTRGNKDLRALADSLGYVQKNTKDMASSLSGMKNVFLGIFAGMGIREVVNMSDQMQQLNSRITLFAGSTENARTIMQALQETANRTKSDIGDLATIYTRFASATKATGVSSETLLKLTETLQNSFRLSGSTLAEATGAAIQLSQSFSMGTLRGQELRSVLSANSVAADILRKKFGDNVYKQAEKGVLSATQVMFAFLDASKKINSDASKLGQTFEQSVTVAMNNFKVKLMEVNQQLGLSSKFASGLESIGKHIAGIGTAIGGIGLLFSAGPFMKFLTWISNLNIYLKIALATIALVSLAVDNWSTIVEYTKKGLIALVGVIGTTAQYFKSFAEDMLVYFPKAQKAVGNFFQGFATAAQNDAMRIQSWGAAASAEVTGVITDLKRLDDQRMSSARVQEAEKKKMLAKEKARLDLENKDNKAYWLTPLNKAFERGRLTIDQYEDAVKRVDLNVLKAQFEEGKTDIQEYQKKMHKLTRLDLPEINRAFRDGKMGFKEFNEAVAGEKIEDLSTALKFGTMSVIEYDKEVSKISNKLSAGGIFRLGTVGYLESIGTTSDQIVALTTKAWSSLEDGFTDFIRKGTADWSKFTDDILDDITRIILRATIIQPLANGLINAVSAPGVGSTGGGGLGSVKASAKGSAYESGIQRFAQGGLVHSPTLFGYGQGKTGLMGEAGTEAILPLRRGSDGNLGVMSNSAAAPTIVNIINNTPADVSTKESTGPNGEKILELVIQNKVKEGIATGAFDKQFQSTYGLKRKGY